MAIVHQEFVAVVGEGGPAHLEQLWLDLWRTGLDAAELEAAHRPGVTEPAPLCAALLRFKEEYKRRRQVGPRGASPWTG